MKKYMLVLLSIILFLSFVSPYIGTAAGVDTLAVEEIGPDYVKGLYTGTSAITLYVGDKLIGQGNAVNQRFEIKLTQSIPAGTALVLKAEADGQQMAISYNPPVINPVDEASQTVSGKVPAGAAVSASVDGQMLTLKSIVNGAFEFQPSSLLTAGKVVQAASELNGVKSIAIQTVSSADAPEKPFVYFISNISTALKGTTEPNSTVNIGIRTNTYIVTADAAGRFIFPLPNNKPLAAGTRISVYVTNTAGKSETATVTVANRIAPAAPQVNKITNKSLLISGKAAPNSTLVVLRNTKTFRTIKVSSQGIFYIGMPLQAANTKFEFYAKDATGNAGARTTIVVGHQNRPASKLMSAPLVKQMPELPRGCEVTSLTMMLNYAGKKANKMTLAKQVKKDPTPYRYVDGKRYFGNPHVGFVGDMYSFSKPGFGVFHRPIAELANTYMPNRIVNFSGQSFESVLDYVGAGRPVWVITTSTFNYVPGKYWQTWYTPQGQVRITYKEHSVLITGYDSKYIYFNDPLDGKKNKRHPKSQFIQGWNQYGKQAISYF
ncbi:C39 family peptidase [Heyndrickxia sp. MSNUG]|uniref:C39 family peptidase n=1 Tax=Heyndrickxia sp. MSNUG TaxID=3136677 RepID=UPI003C2D1674